VSQARVINADAIQGLKQVKDQTVQTCITSPPYWGLRDYGSDDQLGLEPTPEEYTENLVSVFREVRRVLRDDGTLWLNLGDSYIGGGRGGQSAAKRSAGWQPDYALRGYVPTGMKAKDLVGIPWRVAFALQADGWYLRSDIIWHKPNPMPESVTDRPTKAHEYLFLLTKSPRYYYDVDAIREEYLTDNDKGLTKEERLRRNPHLRSGVSRSAVKGFGPSQMKGQPGGRNKRSVWTVTTKPFKGAHFAVFPPDLIEPCVLAGSAEGDTVLDPFTGSGTTGMVALRHGRDFVGTELNPEYAAMAEQRIAEDAPLLNEVAA